MFCFVFKSKKILEPVQGRAGRKKGLCSTSKQIHTCIIYIYTKLSPTVRHGHCTLHLRAWPMSWQKNVGGEQ